MKISNMALGNWGNVKALFTVELDGIWIKGFKVIESNGDLWVGLPSRKIGDEYDDTVLMNKERKTELTDLAIPEYKKQYENKDYHIR